jgi:hypothetical protein
MSPEPDVNPIEKDLCSSGFTILEAKTEMALAVHLHGGGRCEMAFLPHAGA